MEFYRRNLPQFTLNQAHESLDDFIISPKASEVFLDKSI